MRMCIQGRVHSVHNSLSNAYPQYPVIIPWSCLSPFLHFYCIYHWPTRLEPSGSPAVTPAVWVQSAYFLWHCTSWCVCGVVDRHTHFIAYMSRIQTVLHSNIIHNSCRVLTERREFKEVTLQFLSLLEDMFMYLFTTEICQIFWSEHCKLCLCCWLLQFSVGQSFMKYARFLNVSGTFFHLSSCIHRASV